METPWEAMSRREIANAVRIAAMCKIYSSIAPDIDFAEQMLENFEWNANESNRRRQTLGRLLIRDVVL